MGENTELVIKHILKTSVNICGEKNTSVRKVDGAVVTRLPLNAAAWVLLWATCVFHPSQPMPGGFPLEVFFHPQKGTNLFQLEPSYKVDSPGQNVFWVR